MKLVSSIWVLEKLEISNPSVTLQNHCSKRYTLTAPRYHQCTMHGENVMPSDLVSYLALNAPLGAVITTKKYGFKHDFFIPETLIFVAITLYQRNICNRKSVVNLRVTNSYQRILS